MANTRISILVKRASLEFDKLSNQLLVPYDLTGSQFKILMVLFRYPVGSIRQADIEAKFSMTNPTVSGLVQKLEAKKLVERVPNPKDKRSKVLVPTEQAMAIKDDLLALSDKMEGLMSVNLTDAEYDELAALLNKMLNA